MGIRFHTVYFTENPSEDALKQAIEDITDLRLTFISLGEIHSHSKSVQIMHPNVKKDEVTVHWSHLRKEIIVKNKLFQNCLHVESETPKYNYVEISLIYLLKQMGGIIEDDFELPEWAGKKWDDFPKRNFWQSFKDLF